jgi:chromosomal replication initiator protein
MSGAVSIRMILRAVAVAYDIPAHAIAHHRRNRERVRARDAVCLLARELTSYSYPQIGRLLGNRDHTTIMDAAGRATALLAEDEAFARRFAMARETVLSSLGTAARWQDADAVAAAARVMGDNPWRVATDLSVDEIVAVAARAVALEHVAATTYQLLAHLDEHERLRPRFRDPAVQARRCDLLRSCRAMSDSLADVLQGLGYEYAEPEAPSQQE